MFVIKLIRGRINVRKCRRRKIFKGADCAMCRSVNNSCCDKCFHFSKYCLPVNSSSYGRKYSNEIRKMELNKIYNESCLETMSRMPDKLIDLVVTSPPYNMRLRVRDGKYGPRSEEENDFHKKYQGFSDAMPIDEFYELHSRIMRELLRVSKIICYNFQVVTGSKEAFFRMMGDFNRDIKDIIIWDKTYGQPARSEKVLNSAYEMILILEDDKKLGRLIQNAKFKRGEMSNIMRISRKKKHTDIHSAVFPEEMPVKLIEAFSDDGALIYDPFMGSGTTGKAAVVTRRNYIGSEVVQEYCAIADKRIAEAKAANIWF